MLVDLTNAPSSPMDVQISACTELLRIMGSASDSGSIFSSSSTPPKKSLDSAVVMTACERFISFEKKTHQQFMKELHNNVYACEHRFNVLVLKVKQFGRMRRILTKLDSLLNFCRLMIFSLGYDKAAQQGIQYGKSLFDKSYMAAAEVVRIAADVFVPSGRFMYVPDKIFAIAGLSAAFLLKTFKPQFAALLESTQSRRITELVTRLTHDLASDKVAVDEHHSPHIYSRFLGALIEKQNQNGTSLGKSMGSPVHRMTLSKGDNTCRTRPAQIARSADPGYDVHQGPSITRDQTGIQRLTTLDSGSKGRSSFNGIPSDGEENLDEAIGESCNVKYTPPQAHVGQGFSSGSFSVSHPNSYSIENNKSSSNATSEWYNTGQRRGISGHGVGQMVMGEPDAQDMLQSVVHILYPFTEDIDQTLNIGRFDGI
ncbi:hypothetical protein RhiLY_13143 [Ceratobasidium sp. AG-Ba]|nr:hypothetical protein RhiLY_13143 [Ceratobasidium sp. AG-Ba]